MSRTRLLPPLCLALLGGLAGAAPQTLPAPDGARASPRLCEHDRASYSLGAIVQQGSRTLRCVEARVQDSKAAPTLVWVELQGSDGERVSVQMTR